MSERPEHTVEHLGEDGATCTAHSAASISTVMNLASVGARVPSFNHDIASKLQGMMMALDELDELIERRGDSELRRALDTASTSMKELNGLLTANRALTRGAKASRTTLREVLRLAAERSGVSLDGEVVDAAVEVAVPLLVHAIALVLDVATGVQRTRTISITSAQTDGFAAVTIATAATQPPTASELFALAAFGIARERGELRCGPGRVTIKLPIV